MTVEQPCEKLQHDIVEHVRVHLRGELIGPEEDEVMFPMVHMGLVRRLIVPSSSVSDFIVGIGRGIFSRPTTLSHRPDRGLVQITSPVRWPRRRGASWIRLTVTVG
jgi:hypothetical protein